MEEARKTVAQNRKAHFNYIVTDSIECGIALEGSEVKSIKAGNISFGDSFAFIENGEVWLQNFHISEYSFSSVFNHEPDRKKKLLLKQFCRHLRKKPAVIRLFPCLKDRRLQFYRGHYSLFKMCYEE